MQVKITKDGLLKMPRLQDFKLVICPISAEENYCGDWCALFNIEYKGVHLMEDTNIEHYELQLCHKNYQIESVEYETKN